MLWVMYGHWLFASVVSSVEMKKHKTQNTNTKIEKETQNRKGERNESTKEKCFTKSLSAFVCVF